jgi:flagellar hook-associated protein 3 FlgL
MTDRITPAMSSRRMLADLQDASRSLLRAQERMSSQKQISRASDSPARALAAMDQRLALRRSDQFQRNAADARGWLATADATLTGAVDQLTQVRSLVLQGASAGSDPAARAALAAEVRSAHESLLQMANTEYLGRPIFGGTADVTRAYDATGAYQGDTGTVDRPVAPGVSVRVNRTGPEVFGAPAADPLDGDVFQLLGAVATALEGGDQTALQTSLQRLSGSIDRIETAQVELGARAKQVEDVIARTELADLDRRQSLSELEDVDIAEALIDVKAREFAYQAALDVSARGMSTSLLDFLR